jgi:hypothetical protein
MRTLNVPLTTLSIALSLMLTGCNAIYFAETDKASLTIEARPDASSPIAASVGVKQRVVAVVPPRKTATMTPSESPDGSGGSEAMDRAPAGDAVSLLSYFNFEKGDDGRSIGEPVTIELALLTGTAATKIRRAGTETTGTILRSFTPSPRFATAEQATLQSLMDQALTRSDHQQTIVFDRAASIMGDNFGADYQRKIAGGLPPHVAFAATKNTFLGNELTSGRGPKYDRLIEALQLALHEQGEP